MVLDTDLCVTDLNKNLIYKIIDLEEKSVLFATLLRSNDDILHKGDGFLYNDIFYTAKLV